jgi:hypothetical protein
MKGNYSKINQLRLYLLYELQLTTENKITATST